MKVNEETRKAEEERAREEFRKSAKGMPHG